MKTLLPLLRAKLFLLGFVFTSTVIIATTVTISINYNGKKIVADKITTEQKKISPKKIKLNKEINASRVTSNIFFEANKTFEATLTSDAADYPPGSTATLTGTGFTPGETVALQVLHADYHEGDPIGEDHEAWEVDADENGNFVTTWHVCEDDCIGKTLIATADGQTS